MANRWDTDPGLVNSKILRACGVFNSKHECSRVKLKIPNTNGVTHESCWRGRGGSTLLTDDLYVIVLGSHVQSTLDHRGCFFQLNYSPKSVKRTCHPEAVSDGWGVVIEMSRVEQVIYSERLRRTETLVFLQDLFQEDAAVSV